MKLDDALALVVRRLEEAGHAELARQVLAALDPELAERRARARAAGEALLVMEPDVD